MSDERTESDKIHTINKSSTTRNGLLCYSTTKITSLHGKVQVMWNFKKPKIFLQLSLRTDQRHGCHEGEKHWERG